jgi:DNA-binding PadR family transcriptional regulator
MLAILLQFLSAKNRLQASELRSLTGIEHQLVVARIMHTLSRARLVIVERGPGNTAWYRLTSEGKRAARATIEQTGQATQDTVEKRQLVAAGASSHRW